MSRRRSSWVPTPALPWMQTSLQDLPDEELARQTQAGSLASFEALVYRYEGRIYRYLVQRCRKEGDAREITQTTFIAAYRALDQFQPARSFAAWLFAIARHKLIDHCRAARAETETEALPEAWDVNDPSVILARQEEERDAWAQARRLLTTQQFDALWLRYHEEMSVKDIGRVLARTQTSVKVLLFRARQSLVRALGPRKMTSGSASVADSVAGGLGRQRGLEEHESPHCARALLRANPMSVSEPQS